MKKMLPFLVFALITNLSFAQSSFSDDFEGYSAGDMVAASSSVWRTWTNAAGIDAPISGEQASSGSNSLLIQAASATANGPVDIILPFGGKYTTGDFHFEMMMFIDGGAYFNFQGEVTEGEQWTFQPEFRADGTVTINNSDNASVGVVGYPQNEWFKLEVDVDLTLNSWTVSFNGFSVANFANPNSSIASLNLYPLAGHKYFIDDISFEYTEFVPTGKDMAIAGLAVPPRGLNGKEYALGATVINVGVDEVSSFDVAWTAGTNSGSTSVSGVNIGSLESYDVVFSDMYTADNANNDISFTISNVNGSDDDNVDNNTKSAIMGVVTPAPDKMVFVEEGTGTWCGWCPRGAVGMEYMAHEYPEYFAGVAVHNRATDPMLNVEHDAGVTSFPGFTGFPGSIFDRTEELDPGAASLESSFFNYITTAPAVTINNVVNFNGDNREVSIDVEVTAKEDISGDYKIVLIVREDNVTGTAAGYRQANNYSGGGNGEMGGYELLPRLVPADQMVYNEVSRALLTPFGGEPNSLPATMTAGETHTFSSTYTAPLDQNVNEFGIVAVVLNPDGTANNAKLTLHDEWASGTNNATNVNRHEGFKGIAPNPTSDMTFINLDLETAQEVEIQIVNSIGQSMSQRQYGQLSGVQRLPVNAAALANGMYYAKIRIGDQFITRPISVNK